MSELEQPFRNIYSFGVSGTLLEGCRVYYDTLFSTQHVGRVSDLMAAVLRAQVSSELDLRAVLLYSIFEAEAVGNGEPVIVECGMDEERLVIGVGYNVAPGRELALDSIVERVRSGHAETELDTLLLRLRDHSHGIVLKFHPESGRVEIDCLFFKGASAPALQERSIEVSVIEREPDVAPSVGTYIELGDLDYASLLRDRSREVTKEPEQGSVQAISRTPNPLEEVLKAKGEAAERDGLTRIAGEENDRSSKERIVVGGTEELSLGSYGDGGPSGLEVASRSAEVSHEQVQELKELRAKIEKLEEEKSRLSLQVEEARDGAGLPSRVESTIGDLLKKVWPFKKSDDPADTQGAAMGSREAEPSGSVQSEADKFDDGSSEEDLVQEIKQGRFHRMVTRVQQESQDVKQEVKTERAKRWVDGLMSDLVGEKARLFDMAKKIQEASRRKDQELKTRERAVELELKKKDEMLRQKEMALHRVKEQMAQVNMNLERLKGSGRGGTNDAHFKQKLQQSQRLLTVTKDENISLARKVDELRRQVNSLQLAAAKNRGPSQAEHNQLKKSYQTLLRQLEETKRLHQELQQKFVQEKERAAKAAEGEEFKKKFEAAIKMAQTSRKQAQQWAMKAEEFEVQESRVKRDLSAAQSHIKRLEALIDRFKIQEAGAEEPEDSEDSDDGSDDGSSDEAA